MAQPVVLTPLTQRLVFIGLGIEIGLKKEIYIIL